LQGVSVPNIQNARRRAARADASELPRLTTNPRGYAAPAPAQAPSHPQRRRPASTKAGGRRAPPSADPSLRCVCRRWQASERRSPSIAGYRRFGGKRPIGGPMGRAPPEKIGPPPHETTSPDETMPEAMPQINAEGRDFSQPSSFVRKSLSFPLSPTRRKSSLHPSSRRAHHPFGASSGERRQKYLACRG
jgi:hypothetical protein